MNPSRIERIRQLFEQASVLPHEEQSMFLDEHCPEEDIRREVEELLGDTMETTGDFEQIADDAIRSPLSELRREREDSIQPANGGIPFDDPEKAGEQIGPYQLIRLVGEGGFGTVWEAQQESPVKRRVAIKFLKVGMATREIIKRFEAERQALAMMGHANIAQVYDAGATDSGRPYFVMEFVEGMPLTQFCDKYQLSLQERLNVFNLICSAIQHAHQKGIVHRDLKPNNILVHYEDEQTRLNPVLKIIDFGVAKVLRSTTSEHTMVTGLGQMIGTPAYMSPEQASFGIAIPDTRTDVYSLGILLYELLTGTLPFQNEDFKEASIVEIQRILQTKDPQRPSTRLTVLKNNNPDSLEHILDNRDTDFKTLHRTLQTDLDWVIIRCLEKDPERRYSTAHELLLDINRYLNSEPLIAGPPSATYRISKLVRRHRRTALASTFVVLSFVIGFIGTILGLVQATKARIAEAEQRQRAEERTRELELVTDFQQSVFERLVPEQIGAEIFRSMLQSYQELLEIENVAVDERKSRVETLRQNLYQLNPTDLARQTFNDFVLKRSSQAITEQFTDQPMVEAALRESLAQSFQQIGLIQEAIDEQQKVIDLLGELPDLNSNQLGESKLRLASILIDGTFHIEARKILTGLLENPSPVDDALMLRIKLQLSKVEYALHNWEVAEKLINDTYDSFKNLYGPDHELTLEAESESIRFKRHFEYNLGYNSQSISGDPRIASEQITLYEDFLSRAIQILGEDHSLTWKARHYHVEALGLWTHIRELNLDTRPSDEKIKIAIEQLAAVLKSQEKILGTYHPTTLKTHKILVYLQSDPEGSDPVQNEIGLNNLKSILQTELEIWGENHISVVESLTRIAILQDQFGFPDDSIEGTHKAISILERIHERPTLDLADLHTSLAGRILYHYHDGEEALKHAKVALEIAESIGTDADIPGKKLNAYRMSYILCLHATGRLAEAENLCREWDFLGYLHSEIYLTQGRFEEVEKAIAEYKKNFQRSFGNNWWASQIENYYRLRGNEAEADYWWDEAYACAQMSSEGHSLHTLEMQWMAKYCAEKGNIDEAQRWARMWTENKEFFLEKFPAHCSRMPAFPYHRRNPYYSEQAWLLYSVSMWEALGEKEKADSFIQQYFEHKKWIESEGDPELVEGYERAYKSQYSFWFARDEAEVFADRGYFEEAEWLMFRGDRRFRYNDDPEGRRDWYQRIIDFYKDWHEADPDGGHLSQIPQWQEKIDAIDAEYAKWRTEEST